MNCSQVFNINSRPSSVVARVTNQQNIFPVQFLSREAECKSSGGAMGNYLYLYGGKVDCRVIDCFIQPDKRVPRENVKVKGEERMVCELLYK